MAPTAAGCMDGADGTVNSCNENGGSGISEVCEVLCYLRNIFDQTTGGLPKDEEAACSLWSYRKARPNKDSGSADMVPADRESVLNEMRAIRESF